MRDLGAIEICRAAWHYIMCLCEAKEWKVLSPSVSDRVVLSRWYFGPYMYRIIRCSFRMLLVVFLKTRTQGGGVGGKHGAGEKSDARFPRQSYRPANSLLGAKDPSVSFNNKPFPVPYRDLHPDRGSSSQNLLFLENVLFGHIRSG